jgi:hypothetical protein
VQLPEPSDLTKPGSVSRLLVLEGIQDPGNLVRRPVVCSFSRKLLLCCMRTGSPVLYP